MIPLTEGAIDKIMNGIDVDKPVLQVLGHKKLSSSSSGERYRLLVSDGKRINSFTMLATQLNYMITDNLLTEYSICEINRYAISMVHNSGKQKRVMVILDLNVKVHGNEVGYKIGNPTNVDNSADGQSDSSAAPSAPSKQQKNTSLQANKPSSSVDITTIPIAAISPYQNKWVIKVRVTNKSDIRTWSNSRGEGKLFSMDLVDESGEIRFTAFRDQCDKFYSMIETGNIYYISRCVIKAANKQFSTLKNDYEMTATAETEIVPCRDDDHDIPTVQFNFAPISEIENMAKNDMIDILAVVKSYTDVQTLTSKNGRELKKRNLNVVDESNVMVTLTLWGTQAEEFKNDNNPVLAVKGARVGEFNNSKNLGTFSTTIVQVDPDIPAAHKLRGWYNTIGHTENMKSISFGGGGGGGAGSLNAPWYTLKEAKEMKLGKDNADFYLVKATVVMIRAANAVYKACPTEGCNKKLTEQSNEMYKCDKCQVEYPNFKYRLLASANLADWSGNQWVTAFSEDAEKLLGISAQELGELQENNNDAYLQKFSDATFKSYIFKLRVKLETFQDESRFKHICTAIVPLNYTMYNNQLLTEIKKIANIEGNKHT